MGASQTHHPRLKTAPNRPGARPVNHPATDQQLAPQPRLPILGVKPRAVCPGNLSHHRSIQLQPDRASGLAHFRYAPLHQLIPTRPKPRGGSGLPIIVGPHAQLVLAGDILLSTQAIRLSQIGRHCDVKCQASARHLRLHAAPFRIVHVRQNLTVTLFRLGIINQPNRLTWGKPLSQQCVGRLGPRVVPPPVAPPLRGIPPPAAATASSGPPSLPASGAFTPKKRTLRPSCRRTVSPSMICATCARSRGACASAGQ